MLLVIDIGNTNIVIGIYKGKKLLHHWRVSSRQSFTVDECFLLLNQILKEKDFKLEKINSGIIASVVPPLTLPFEQMFKEHFGFAPLLLSPKLETGLKILYRDPSQVGADRIANAVAALTIYGGPIIVVDLGTATTFDVVTKEGEYLGGVIAPGVETSAEELFKRTAKLPRVELKQVKKVIGQNTEESIKSGIFYGTIGQIDEIVRRIKKEIGREAKVIATGGMAAFIFPSSQTIEKLDPLLTLEGLRIIYEMNRKIYTKKGERSNQI